MRNIPLSLTFPCSFDHRGFCRVNFHFFDTNFFSVNPESRHYVTLATPKVVPARRAKSFTDTRKNCPACQGYPTCRDETTRPPELSCPPRGDYDPNVNGWSILQRNKVKLTLARVTRGMVVSGTEFILMGPRCFLGERLNKRKRDWFSL